MRIYRQKGGLRFNRVTKVLVVLTLSFLLLMEVWFHFLPFHLYSRYVNSPMQEGCECAFQKTSEYQSDVVPHRFQIPAPPHNLPQANVRSQRSSDDMRQYSISRNSHRNQHSEGGYPAPISSEGEGDDKHYETPPELSSYESAEDYPEKGIIFVDSSNKFPDRDVLPVNNGVLKYSITTTTLLPHSNNIEHSTNILSTNKDDTVDITGKAPDKMARILEKHDDITDKKIVKNLDEIAKIPSKNPMTPDTAVEITNTNNKIRYATSKTTLDTTIKTPDTNNKIPDTTTHIPGTPNKIPDTTTHIPGITNKIPDTTTHIPGTNNKIPDTTNKIPDTPSKIPDATTHIPGTNNKIPDSTNKIPDTTNKIPDTPSKIPDTTNKIPDSTNKIPDTTNKIPDTINKIPDTTNKIPDTTTNIPDTTSKTPQLARHLTTTTTTTKTTTTTTTTNHHGRTKKKNKKKPSLPTKNAPHKTTIPLPPVTTSSPPRCILRKTDLLGQLTPKKEVPSLEIQEQNHPELSAGGHYQPPSCQANQSVSIIIPYRDRLHHLTNLLYHLHPVLQRQMVEYTIFVVEQTEGKTFNRGMVKNIGAKEAGEIFTSSCLIFHDVDLIPLNDYNLYNCYKWPRHMSVGVDTMNFGLLYEALVGGVLSVPVNQFVMVNGYSNGFWGWGAEDDDLYNRFMKYGLKVLRFSPNTSRYHMLTHKKDKPNPYRYSALTAGELFYDKDGLNSLKYKVKKMEKRPLYTWIHVEF
ncbi:hypothetical protein Pcinc_020500 [Petrolisthes cinctipes]|uniref:Uncharacterized protein n=1 Tax=Petrolisthes cinctipes TaxID=88211 RepID=A0AAE1FJB3_PETCI|nr:hypothetical protein Pcinc_020500 [Petrolisthes cinctipes]